MQINHDKKMSTRASFGHDGTGCPNADVLVSREFDVIHIILIHQFISKTQHFVISLSLVFCRCRSFTSLYHNSEHHQYIRNFVYWQLSCLYVKLRYLIRCSLNFRIIQNVSQPCVRCSFHYRVSTDLLNTIVTALTTVSSTSDSSNKRPTTSPVGAAPSNTRSNGSKALN